MCAVYGHAPERSMAFSAIFRAANVLRQSRARRCDDVRAHAEKLPLKGVNQLDALSESLSVPPNPPISLPCGVIGASQMVRVERREHLVERFQNGGARLEHHLDASSTSRQPGAVHRAPRGPG